MFYERYYGLAGPYLNGSDLASIGYSSYFVSRPGLGAASAHQSGTLLKRQIASHAFADWTDARPGFFEMDLIAYCGWTGAVPFLHALTGSTWRRSECELESVERPRL